MNQQHLFLVIGIMLVSLVKSQLIPRPSQPIPYTSSLRVQPCTGLGTNTCVISNDPRLGACFWCVDEGVCKNTAQTCVTLKSFQTSCRYSTKDTKCLDPYCRDIPLRYFGSDFACPKISGFYGFEATLTTGWFGCQVHTTDTACATSSTICSWCSIKNKCQSISEPCNCNAFTVNTCSSNSACQWCTTTSSCISASATCPAPNCDLISSSSPCSSTGGCKWCNLRNVCMPTAMNCTSLPCNERVGQSSCQLDGTCQYCSLTDQCIDSTQQCPSTTMNALFKRTSCVEGTRSCDRDIDTYYVGVQRGRACALISSSQYGLITENNMYRGIVQSNTCRFPDPAGFSCAFVRNTDTTGTLQCGDSAASYECTQGCETRVKVNPTHLLGHYGRIDCVGTLCSFFDQEYTLQKNYVLAPTNPSFISANVDVSKSPFLLFQSSLMACTAYVAQETPRVVVTATCMPLVTVNSYAAANFTCLRGTCADYCTNIGCTTSGSSVHSVGFLAVFGMLFVLVLW